MAVDALGDMVGSTILVRVSYVDAAGGVTRVRELAGTVTSVDPLVAIELADGEIFTLPPEPEAFEIGTRGEYHLHTSGEVVIDPAFTSIWTVKAPPEKDRSGQDALVGAAVVAMLVAFLYSAMLGFGVNERCSSNGNSSGYCDWLWALAVVHAVAQAVLVVACGGRLMTVRRTHLESSRTSQTVAVVAVYLCVAFVLTAVYTHVAWVWANGSG